jgi:uncharacterized protein YggE
MKKLICMIGYIIFGAINVVSAQNQVDSVNFIKVNSLMNVPVEQYVVVFNVVQTAETITEADKIIDSRIQKFASDLINMGIDKIAINTETVKLFPLYSYYSNVKFSSTYNEIPQGFEIHKNVSIVYKSADYIDKIFVAAVRNEIYDIIKIDYFILDIEKAMDSVRKKSMQTALTKSKAFGTGGIKLDILKADISEEFTTLYPQTQYQTYNPKGEISFPLTGYSKKKRKRSYGSVRKLESGIPTEITGHYTLYKPKSPYFNSVNYGAFDVIINPVIIEPVVQIKYSLTIKYPINN